MGFQRRYSYYPTQQQITEIEGVVIVSTTTPSAIVGVGTGTTCCVGECQDATYAVAVSSAGVVTTKCTPVEISSPQDFADKCGSFDSTIGQFGTAGGNMFAIVRNKSYARFVAAPIDNITPLSTTQYAIRVWRELPTNVSTTSAVPITLVTAAAVVAGTEFKSGNNRVRIAKTVKFTDEGAYMTGTDGTVTAAGAPAATQSFNIASGSFVTAGVQAGDILVVGVIGGAGANGSNANNYRVVSVTDADTIVVEKLDGTTFDWTTGASLVYRLHVGSTADSAASVGGVHVALSSASGSVVPARPLDATIAAATTLTPTVVPTASSATNWDVLSGLTARTHPTGALTYDANVHALNAANNSTLDARYQTAFDACAADDTPTNEINIIFAARHSATINAKGRSHVIDCSSKGLTRVFISAPELSVQNYLTATADTSTGVGANRAERVFYAWPGHQESIPEAVGFTIATADGRTTTDGILDCSAAALLASICSNMPPERNPAEESDLVQSLMVPVRGIQRGVSPLNINEYKTLRAKGVVALKRDKTRGFVFQSGVTSSLTSGQTNINRIRMADFCEDSMADALGASSKQVLTDNLKTVSYASLVQFCEGLLSRENPAAQRIQDYTINDRAGNTPNGEAAGIWVYQTKIRMLATADFFVIQSEVGPNVEITTRQIA